MSWLDEMKTFENVDDIVELIVGLSGYHGGTLCIDKEIFMKKFPWLNNNEDSLIALSRKLMCKGIRFKRIRMVNTLDKLEDSYDTIYIIQDVS